MRDECQHPFCINDIGEIDGDVKVYPLPHMPVIKDLVPDLKQAYAQYASIEPWLKTKTPPPPDRERLQSPKSAKPDGLWECVLCFCCSTSCQVTGGMETVTWASSIVASLSLDSRLSDEETGERLDNLEDPFRL